MKAKPIESPLASVFRHAPVLHACRPLSRIRAHLALGAHLMILTLNQVSIMMSLHLIIFNFLSGEHLTQISLFFFSLNSLQEFYCIIY